MSEDPKQDYDAPKVEEIETADAPAVTAAGQTTTDFQESDRRLKHSLRALEARIPGFAAGESQGPERGYQAPTVEE